MSELIFREIPARQVMHLCGPWQDYSTNQAMRMSDQELEAIRKNPWSDKYLCRAALDELVCRRFLSLPYEERTDEALEVIWDQYLPF